MVQPAAVAVAVHTEALTERAWVTNTTCKRDMKLLEGN
jgi:hypothetical protein